MPVFTYKKLLVRHAELPCEKEVTLGGVSYWLGIAYNAAGDFYTGTLKDITGAIRFTGKFAYMTNLIDAVIAGLRPGVRIIPVDEADLRNGTIRHARLGKSNFDQIDIAIFEN